MDAYFYLAAYALGLAAITYRARRQTDADYLNGSKKLSGWDSTWTTFASLLTGYNFVLGVTFAYLYGLWYLMAFVGAGAGFVVLYFFYTHRLAQMQSSQTLYSIGDYFGVLYGKGPRRFVNTILCVALFLFLTLQMFVNSELFATLFGVSRNTALVSLCSVVTLYLWFGGFKTSVKTDIFQGILILPIALTIVVFPSHITWHGVLEVTDRSQFGLAVGLASLQFLSLLAQPESFQRIFAGRDARAVGRGLAQALVLLTIVAGSVAYLGINFRLAQIQLDPSKLFVEGVLPALPAWLSSILSVSLVAAFMGTIDSSAFALGILLARTRIHQEDRQLVMLTRYLTVAVMLTAGFASLYLFSFLSAAFALISLVSIVGAALCLSLIFAPTARELMAFLVLGTLAFLAGLQLGIITDNPLTALLPSVVGVLAPLALRVWRYAIPNTLKAGPPYG